MAARLTFNSISRLRYHAVRARIRAQAEEMSCTGDAGTATGDNITIAWTYDEDTQRLAFTCMKLPWYKTEGFVCGRIFSLMEAL
jgi:hypothetical protein